MIFICSGVMEYQTFLSWYNEIHICNSPIIHLVCPPKVYISIIFTFSWDDYNTREKNWGEEVYYG